MPSREDVRCARRSEFLGHPAGTDAHIEPAVAEMVDGRKLGGQDRGAR